MIHLKTHHESLRGLKTICLSSLCAIAFCGLALAHSGASGIVKKRMDAMGEIAQSMKSLAGMTSGKIKFDQKTIVDAATQIRDHASQMPGLFPEGSIIGPSEARPEIWQEWAIFKKIASETETAADAIVENAADLEAIRTQFAILAKTCSSCHEKFRIKK